eukprot:5102578-Pleurochrysis_carterae.AAC.1
MVDDLDEPNIYNTSMVCRGDTRHGEAHPALAGLHTVGATARGHRAARPPRRAVRAAHSPSSIPLALACCA